MECKIKGCQNQTKALDGLCLECACKVWWVTHNKKAMKKLLKGRR